MDKPIDWNRVWQNIDFTPISNGSFFTSLLDQSIAARQGGRALEIGCYPGRFIEYVGRMGFEISGIDTFHSVVGLEDVFKKIGHKVGGFFCEDFLLWKPPQQYDLVFSLGFVEHFQEWPRVIKLHADLVRPGGRLVIGCPNMTTPVQQVLHRLVDSTSLGGHVLSAMYPLAWSILIRHLGFEVLLADHVGPFQFFPGQEQNLVPELEELRRLALILGADSAGFGEKFNRLEAGYILMVADCGQSRANFAEADMEKFFTDMRKIGEQLAEKDRGMANQNEFAIRRLLHIG